MTDNNDEFEVISVVATIQNAFSLLASRNLALLASAFDAIHPYVGRQRMQIPSVKIYSDEYRDCNARGDFRFTIAELKMLSTALHIPEIFKSTSGDA